MPFIKAALTADPLNFRARQFLFEQEDDFRSAALSARQTLDAAPFSLPVAEGYTKAILDCQLHEQAIEKRPLETFEADVVLFALEDANRLRRIVELAVRFVVTPSEQTLNDFLVVAKQSPKKSFPYAWEILQLLEQRGEEVRAVLDGSLGAELRSLVRGVLENDSLVAEAYLLDFAAVEARGGLLLDAITHAYVESLSGGISKKSATSHNTAFTLRADALGPQGAFS